MKQIVGYLRSFFIDQNKAVFLLATLFTALLVFVNYRFNVNGAIYRLSSPLIFLAWYGVFLTAFGAGYLLQGWPKKNAKHNRRFLILLLLAPTVFAWKMAATLDLQLSADYLANEYWNDVLYWPYKVAVIMAMLGVLYLFFHRGQPFFGLSAAGFTPRPYLQMLLLMVPLVAAAATQPDFLSMYPRMKAVPYLLQPERTGQILLYQLSYGLDFFSIELFFRGFLVLGFLRWAGRNAVLPMAMFYCTIHFGKPLGECISSYFGGLILGVVTYHTRSILGGFMVHVGIAWLMEAAGFIAHRFF